MGLENGKNLMDYVAPGATARIDFRDYPDDCVYVVPERARRRTVLQDDGTLMRVDIPEDLHHLVGVADGRPRALSLARLNRVDPKGLIITPTIPNFYGSAVCFGRLMTKVRRGEVDDLPTLFWNTAFDHTESFLFDTSQGFRAGDRSLRFRVHWLMRDTRLGWLNTRLEDEMSSTRRSRQRVSLSAEARARFLADVKRTDDLPYVEQEMTVVPL